MLAEERSRPTKRQIIGQAKQQLTKLKQLKLWSPSLFALNIDRSVAYAPHCLDHIGVMAEFFT